MLRPGIKKLAVFVMLLYVFIVNSSYTSADIFADRVVSHNKFSATTVDFTARSSFNSSYITSLFHSLGIQPDGFDLGAIRLRAETNSKLKYSMRIVQTNGDNYFCSRLQSQVVNRNLAGIASDSLTDLSFLSSFNGTDPKDLIFFVSLEDNAVALKNKICEFNIYFKTYRNNPDETGGIYAERKISNVISSGDWQ
jgi:hypothetical protein